MDLDSSSATGKSLTTTAFELIRADILLGRLLPSERLRVQALSERYGVGATGIREALSRLVTEGLVDVEDQRGFCVSPVSREALLDLTETRIGVERLALSRAVLHGDVEWETNMLSAYHRLSRTPVPTDPVNHQAWATVHRQFHEALIRGCASPWLQRLCRLLYDQAERYRNLAELEMRSEPNLRDTFAEHKALLDAAMERDNEKLSILIGEHLTITTEIILKAGFDRTMGDVRVA
ncbi:DNA-binding transcriptional regulator, GntR family [Paraburkholderia steynii]|uniref:DNA-binding transcriptional regulator, GntR family n=1 Tax=Paraburkholderia steynii TaxID=1245441 RepID=A0A7Z7BDL5_9BURK|nr:FCD domain-containing protein [Paraburkholderia steynii]SDI49950.1 DNA-binding transcriptional regulator, GntR family [Paraburkholderia steynii]